MTLVIFGLGVLADEQALERGAVIHPLAIVPVEVSCDPLDPGRAVFSAPGASYLNRAGEPDVPWQVATLLLPPGTDLAGLSVHLASERWEPVKGAWRVALAAPALTWQGEALMPDTAPLSPDAGSEAGGATARPGDGQPDETIRLLNAGRLGPGVLVQIAVPLVRHRPQNAALERLVEATVACVSLEPAANGSTVPVPLAARARATIRALAANRSSLDRWYDGPLPGVRTVAPHSPGSGPGLAIVTTTVIAAQSQQLAPFEAWKRAQGFRVVRVTEADFGGGTGDQAATNLRTWLQAHHEALGLEVLLLIGNPNPATGDVPMKMMLPKPGYPTPTDFYYADLTGNWDLDGDGQFGEYAGDFGPGGVDRFCELVVGRIPYYGNRAHLDSILGKIMAYQQAPAAEQFWRRSALLPMANVDDWTASFWLGEAIRMDILDGSGWSSYRLYDQPVGNLDPPPESAICTQAATAAAWQARPCGLVVWWAHGSDSNARDVIGNSQLAGLSNNLPAVTFQVSCQNARPESAQNLAYSLLRQGAVCTVGATRDTWFVQSESDFAGRATHPGMAYEFALRTVRQGLAAGDALQGLRQAVPPGRDSEWMNYVSVVLYGDPTTQITEPDRPVRNLTQATRHVTVQDALDVAVTGDEIVLSPGVYSGAGNRELRFLGKALVLRGEDPGSPANVEATSLLYGSRLKEYCGVRLLASDSPGLRLEGISFSNDDTQGAAILGTSVSPTIARCRFTHISSSRNGVGIQLRSSSAVIQDCTFSDIRAPYARDAALSIMDGSPVITGCRFEQIVGNSSGGALGLSGVGNPRIHGCVVTGVVAARGPALNSSVRGLARVEDCFFAGNTATESGGAIASSSHTGHRLVLANCAIVGNRAQRWGGGVAASWGGTVVIEHCTMSDNRAGEQGGAVWCRGSNAELLNSICWQNAAPLGPALAVEGLTYPVTTAQIAVSVSCVEGGPAGVLVGNDLARLDWTEGFVDNPRFRAPGVWSDPGTPNDLSDDLWTAGDYRLQPGSPCIDVAPASSLDHDLDGQPRPQDGDGSPPANSDLGAWECAPTLDLDSDRDGLCDADETVAGTDPLNPAECFRIVECFLAPDGQGLRLAWSSVAGRVYQLETSSGPGGGFAAVAGPLTATPPQNSLVWADPSGPAALFRVRVSLAGR